MDIVKQLRRHEGLSFVNGIAIMGLCESIRLLYNAYFTTHESLILPAFLLVVTATFLVLATIVQRRSRVSILDRMRTVN